MGNGLSVQVLGSGCPSCKRLHETVKEAVAEMGLEAEVEYVTDVRRIVDLGVMTSPALVVNGEVAAAGSVPGKEAIKAALGRHLTR